MKACTHCGKQIQDTALICQFCKAPLWAGPPHLSAGVAASGEELRTAASVFTVIGAALVFMGLFLYLTNWSLLEDEATKKAASSQVDTVYSPPTGVRAVLNAELARLNARIKNVAREQNRMKATLAMIPGAVLLLSGAVLRRKPAKGPAEAELHDAERSSTSDAKRPRA